MCNNQDNKNDSFDDSLDIQDEFDEQTLEPSHKKHKKKRKRKRRNSNKNDNNTTTIVIIISSVIALFVMLYVILQLITLLVFAVPFGMFVHTIQSNISEWDGVLYESHYDTHMEEFMVDGRDYTLVFNIETIEDFYDTDTSEIVGTTVTIENDERQSLNVEVPDVSLTPQDVKAVSNDDGLICVHLDVYDICANFSTQEMDYFQVHYD